MQILDNQLNVQSLGQFGEEAIRLFENRDFKAIAEWFGYAVAFDRDQAKAIERDLD